MITTTPRLRIRRPSPTTAEFTVTTLPSSKTPTRILLLLRLLLALATLLLLHALWAASCPPLAASPETTTLRNLLVRYERSPAGALFAQAAASMPRGVVMALCLSACYLLGRRVHRHESLLVLRGLGVQTSESSGTLLGGASTRFIPTEKIQDIFVNEAFRGFEVRYYLVVVVEGEGELVVVFPGLLPRRAIVEEVWRGARECLYEKRDVE